MTEFMILKAKLPAVVRYIQFLLQFWPASDRDVWKSICCEELFHRNISECGSDVYKSDVSKVWPEGRDFKSKRGTDSARHHRKLRSLHRLYILRCPRPVKGKINPQLNNFFIFIEKSQGFVACKYFNFYPL